MMRVIDRCRLERKEMANLAATEAHAARIKITPLSEPVRDCLFCIPGAGKSFCLKLLRRFFEECLGWEDGVQFQCLASQNTMAALIGGSTVHSWGDVPVKSAVTERSLTSRRTQHRTGTNLPSSKLSRS